MREAAPVQTELHRHLDVSARLTTLLELAQSRGIEAQSTSIDRFREKIILTRPMNDLSSVLATMELFQRVLDTPETLERIAFEAVEDCYLEGTRKIEFRFSPSFVGEKSGLSWKTVLDGFTAGVRKAISRYPEIRVGLLCIASRDYGCDEVERTAEFFLENRSSFVGFDLAGNETGFPCRIFESAFRKLRVSGARITIHAGEATGPENIWEAIDLLGAHRIGHGISAIQDPRLIERLLRDGICLEMCPTSNWITRAVTSFETHPLALVLRQGVKACINTDDPGIFGVSLRDEMRIAREKIGLTDAELSLAMRHAHESSFIPGA